jgi:hypothetical protein
VVDAFRVESARPADDSVNFVPFGEQQFRQVRAVLPGNSRDECSFHVWFLPLLLPQPYVPRLIVIFLQRFMVA